MIKIWNEAFWKAEDKNASRPAEANVSLLGHLIPIGLLAGITLVVGLAAGPIFAFAQKAGDQLADPSLYIRIVLQKGTP